jgi:hypothetical protein
MASNKGGPAAVSEDTVLAEAERIFAPFNERGGIRLTDTDGAEFDLGIADSFIPVRAVPGAGGGWDVWVLWKELGYTTEMRHGHTVRLTGLAGHGTTLDLTEDNGRKYRITLDADPARWQEWQRFKKDNRALYDRREANMLDYARHVAGAA